MEQFSESIETLNKRLIEHFGIETTSGDAMFRLVWSADQYEKRMSEYTKEGFLLPFPMVVELPKYNHYVQPPTYIIERLVIVPEHQRKELAEIKKSYEPIWAFYDRSIQPLNPTWDSIKFVIDCLYAALGKSSLNVYVPNEIDENTPEALDERAKRIEKELFGNETDTGDALAHKQAIIVPRNYKEVN